MATHDSLDPHGLPLFGMRKTFQQPQNSPTSLTCGIIGTYLVS
jgi:hypothetical protein